jgi:prepilin-type processing-associated H-X9-DG protein
MAEIFGRMDAYHCPSLTTEVHKLHYISNGVDYERFARTWDEDREEGVTLRDCGNWESGAASQLEKLPFAPSAAIYVAEANLDELSEDWYGRHDMFNPGHFPFGKDEKPNLDSRMINADDDRHLGKTTVVFFDGHAERRELTDEDLGLEHFNPLWSSE